MVMGCGISKLVTNAEKGNLTAYCSRADEAPTGYFVTGGRSGSESGISSYLVDPLQQARGG
jgi:hypothetical protein